MNILRGLKKHISEDLASKMVLLGGPRQVGKTTLGKEFLKAQDQYLNWDDLSDRQKLKKHLIPRDLGIVLFDEIHKYVRWRSLLKGLYDKYSKELKIIVTGSARLDHFRKGGDSLFGRFFYYRLHPLSYSEVRKYFGDQSMTRLLNFGGFPEPLIKGEKRFLRRWHNERVSRVVYQDIRDLSTIKEVSSIELLVDLLPSRVGSLLSQKSLQEDLEVSPNTIKRWIDLLNKVYYCYTISPYGSSKIRALKKRQKLYLWDWSTIESDGARFENLVASQLLKYCHYHEDVNGYKMELRYIRDTEGREVDFVVIRDKKPLFAVECKTGEGRISPHLEYFSQRINIPHFYQVHMGKVHNKKGNIIQIPFQKFCRELQMP